MARPKSRHVVPRGDQWANERAGSKRATSLHDNKVDAVGAARSAARKEGSELVVHNRDGRIASKDSHGRDPRHVKG